MRRSPALLLLVASLAIAAAAQSVPSYEIRLAQENPPVLKVTASIPVSAPSLNMDQTRPADVPEVGEKGWPALVQSLALSDGQGRTHELKPEGDAGWRIADQFKGPARLSYSVDYTLLSKNAWPAPREAAFQDADHIVVVGRSLFITTPSHSRSRVKFVLPPGWHVIAPWTRADCHACFDVPTRSDLAENLLVITRDRPRTVAVEGFTVTVTPFGPWHAVQTQLNQLISSVLREYVPIFGKNNDDRQQYSVVLLPQADSGGESYRASFALNFPSTPVGHQEEWGHTLAHELFHYWNGWRLQGEEYASSQWFQEGFTEYLADLAMLDQRLISPDQFQDRLARYSDNYKNLATPMTRPGNRKGPPLYSAGALVAFAWDVEIRKRTGFRKSIKDMFAALWRETESGTRPYNWAQITKALEQTSGGDWQDFYRAYIDGSERLPLAAIFENAGLEMKENKGVVRISDQPATPEAGRFWNQFTHQGTGKFR